MTILQACRCKKMNRHRQNGSSFVIKKILTRVPREIRRGLKATADKRVTTLLSLYPHSFWLLSVSFSQSLVFPGRLCSKLFQHILDIVGLSKAEFWRTYQTNRIVNWVIVALSRKPAKENKGSSKHSLDFVNNNYPACYKTSLYHWILHGLASHWDKNKK